VDKNNVKIIIGSHGSGKSDWIYNRFINMSKKVDGTTDFTKKFYIVVPEQDTNEAQRSFMEKSLVSDAGGGMINVDVVSFDRIAHTVFDILGIEPAKEKIVDDDVKTMILSHILSRLDRENKLKFSHKLSKRVGFVTKLTKAMSEFYAYNVSDEDIDKVILDKRSDVYKDKLLDLKLIFSEFKKVLLDLGISIKEDKYDLLDKKIDLVNIFDDSYVAFDGFTGFTPIQFSIFDKISKVAKEVYFSIDLRDADEIKDMNLAKDLDDADVFYLSKKFIKDIARTKGIKDIKDLLFKEGIISGNKKYTDDRDDLLCLERNLYKTDFGIYDKEVKNISCYAAADIREEVDNTVQIIFDLVRNHDIKYNDIKILVPSIDAYRNIIIKTFDKYRIPLFIDDSENVMSSSYIELIRAAIDVVNYNFSYDSIMRFFSSGLIEKDENIYRFYNLVLSHAMRGYDRYKRGIDIILGEMNDEAYSESIKNVKESYIDPLLNLYEKIYKKDGDSIENYCISLERFVKEVKLDEKLAIFTDVLKEKEKTDLSLHRNVLMLDLSKETFSHTMYNMKNIFNYYTEKTNAVDTSITIEEFKRMLDVGFSSKSLKSIPYLLDEVVVGDLTRTRFNNPRVEIFLGLCDSAIPRKSSDNNLIDDKVRELFSSNVKELSQTTIETALNQRFYIYLALTNPRDKLILSYTNKGADGEEDQKSQVLYMIDDIFPKLKVENVDRDSFKFYREKDLIAYVASNIENVKKSGIKDADNKYKYIFDEETYKKIIKSKRILKYLKKNGKLSIDQEKLLYRSFYRKNANLNTSLTDDLHSLSEKKGTSSVTDIEQYNVCPYRYFMDKTLKLHDDKAYAVENYDMGNMVHEVFEKLFKKIDVLDKNKEFIRREIDETVDGVYKTYGVFNEFNMKEKKFFGANKLEYIKTRLRSIVYKSVDIMMSIKESSKSILDGTEVSFEYMMPREDAKNFAVKGKIDRIDIYDDGEDSYVSVVDYKSGFREKEVDKKNIENGTSIQLILYIDYCINKKYLKDDKKPHFVGTYYFWVEDAFIRNDNMLEENAFDRVARKQKGLGGLSTDDEKVLHMVYNDINLELKDKGGIKGVEFNNGYKLADKYVSEGELDDMIKSMRDAVYTTLDKMNEGAIDREPVTDSRCSYCAYSSICHREQIIENE